MPDTPTLPAQPILDAVEARGGLTEVLGLAPSGLRVTRHRHAHDTNVRRWAKAYHRMRTSGTVTVWAADRFCMKVLGANPELIYGRDWWTIDDPQPAQAAR